MLDDRERERIIKANLAYHAALAETYDDEQPHFKQENIEKVDAFLKSLAATAGDNSLVDLGCGTGFVINIAKKYFKRVVGVDITQQMLDRVDGTGGNVELCKADTSDTPLDPESFNVCTAYGFLHHLHEVKPTFQEAYRLLKQGGIFYADLDPNYYYWDMIKNIQHAEVGNDILQRETGSIVDKVTEIAEQFNLDRETIELAEYQKIVKGGFRENEIIRMLQEAGFVSIDYRYEWYLGQGFYHHSDPARGAIIEEYLRNFLPATRQLFKYVSFVARRQ